MFQCFQGSTMLVFCCVLFGLHKPSICHEVYPNVLAEQLDQYCEWKMSHTNGTHARLNYEGKEGPMGPPGPQGPPGAAANVDYRRINNMIRRGNSPQDRKISMLEEKVIRLEEALRKFSTKGCRGLNSSNAKIVNETGGVFDIYPGDGSRAVEVYCDTVVDGGGWIVFQRRMDGSENFHRNFIDYEMGFGRRQGEFWLGLANLHLLTKNGAELRVDLTDWDGNTAYAKYSTFIVGDASTQYTLTVGGYSGTAGDSFANQNGQKFHTKDRDKNSCSANYKGGMWYNNCHYVNLNGIYIDGGSYSGAYGVEWYHWKGRYGNSMKFVEMKLRI